MVIPADVQSSAVVPYDGVSSLLPVNAESASCSEDDATAGTRLDQRHPGMHSNLDGVS